MFLLFLLLIRVVVEVEGGRGGEGTRRVQFQNTTILLLHKKNNLIKNRMVEHLLLLLLLLAVVEVERGRGRDGTRRVQCQLE